MEILQIKDKDTWEDFVIQNEEDSFLQSWNWGYFNKISGEKIWRIGIYKDNKIAAVALVILVKAKRGKFLFVPHGPVIKKEFNKKEILDFLKQDLKKLSTKEKASFIRISSTLENDKENKDIFKEIGFIDAPIHMMHPETTWILDIQSDEEEILKNMRKTHRNLIRRAKKDGVEILQSKSEEFLKEFYKIHMETVERHKFVPFSYEYIKKELDAFSEDSQICIFLAKYKEEIISSAIVVFYGQEAFYHHGASSFKYSKVPSSYLTLFEAIKEAQKRGLKKFNFYGIVEDKPKHPWYGLSRFKKGFGGYRKDFLHCQDLKINNKYYITYFIEKIRKIKRGY